MSWIPIAAIAVLVMLTAETVTLGQSVSGSNRKDLEESARASWQPVRDLSNSATKKRPAAATVRLVDHQMTTRIPQSGTTQSGISQSRTRRGVPTPAKSVATNLSNRQNGSPATLSRPVVSQTSVPLDTVPMDGQVVFEPMHEPMYETVHEPMDSAVYDPMYGPMHGPMSGPMYGGGCDSMSGGGCGDGGCDGNCGASFGGCDGIGCSAGNCCNGDPMCGEYRDCNSLRPCVTLCWPQDGWFSAEYLMWWQDGVDLPPLASTGRLADIAPLANGRVLYGDDEVLDGQRDGWRFDFGFWLDNCHTWGIGAGFFELDEDNDRFFAGAGTSPLVRPIFAAGTGTDPNNLIEAVALVNDNTRDHSGQLNINVTSELSGWDVYVRHFRHATQGCTHLDPCSCPTRWCSRTEHRVGFRQVELNEGIGINSNVQVAPGTSSQLSFVLNESFDTFNQFNGIDFGWFHTRSMGYWNFDAGLRLAVGNSRQRVRINGSTVVTSTPTGTPTTVQGGLLALNSNIGKYERDEFAVLPELDLKMGYQLTDQLRATFGYTFLYYSNVVRPGDQIERIVDLAQVPNSNAPTPTKTFPRFAFDNTDYWAQGLSFGLDYRW